MLILVSNPELYQCWLAYYNQNFPDMPRYEKTTFSFFKNEKGEIPYK